MSLSSIKKRLMPKALKESLEDLESFLDELMASLIGLQKPNKLLIHLFLPPNIAFWTQVVSAFYFPGFWPHDSLILLVFAGKY